MTAQSKKTSERKASYAERQLSRPPGEIPISFPEALLIAAAIVIISPLMLARYLVSMVRAQLH